MHLTDEQLDDYADGVMGGPDSASADAHLATCERCHHALDATRALLATATRERAAIVAPAELWPLVASSTIHLATMRRAVLRSMRGALITAALAVAAATAVVTWKVARWTSAPRVEPARAGAPGPGRHAGHPVAPTAPIAPVAPRP
jgi:predicted anti-sigma-YlaC factor YlaD